MTRKIFIMFFAAATSYCAIPSGLYAEAASPISRIGILIPESAPGESQTIKGLKDGLKDLGYIEGNNLVVELRDAKGDRSALKTGAADLVSKKVDVIFTTGSRATEAAKAATRQIPIVFRHPDDLIESQANLIFDGAKKLKLATMFDQENWATKGSLATYGPNYAQMGRQAAELIDKLLKGAKPNDVPVRSASKFDLVINLRIANIIGLNIAPETLNKADRVIRLPMADLSDTLRTIPLFSGLSL